MDIGNSLPVQWLGPDAFTVVDLGSIPGWGTKIAKATWHCQKNKQTKPPDGWINKVWLIHTREYDSAFIKKEGTLSHTMTGRKLEDITLSDVSESVSRSVVSDSLRPHGAHQAPLSMDFSWQRYWRGLPFPSPATVTERQILCDCAHMRLPRWLSGKEAACQHKRRGFHLWVWKIRWRRKWQPTPEFLPGKSHGQRSLAGYSSWGCK